MSLGGNAEGRSPAAAGVVGSTADERRRTTSDAIGIIVLESIAAAMIAATEVVIEGDGIYNTDPGQTIRPERDAHDDERTVSAFFGRLGLGRSCFSGSRVRARGSESAARRGAASLLIAEWGSHYERFTQVRSLTSVRSSDIKRLESET